jgi:hypothetical protein
MPKYKIQVYQPRILTYLVEAADEQTARDEAVYGTEKTLTGTDCIEDDTSAISAVEVK